MPTDTHSGDSSGSISAPPTRRSPGAVPRGAMRICRRAADLGAPGEIARFPTLPSFLYFPTAAEQQARLAAPAVGRRAARRWRACSRAIRARSCPARQIASAKSWLANPSVDRTAALPAVGGRRGPAAVAGGRFARVCSVTLRDAWNHEVARTRAGHRCPSNSSRSCSPCRPRSTKKRASSPCRRRGPRGSTAWSRSSKSRSPRSTRGLPRIAVTSSRNCPMPVARAGVRRRRGNDRLQPDAGDMEGAEPAVRARCDRRAPPARRRQPGSGAGRAGRAETARPGRAQALRWRSGSCSGASAALQRSTCCRMLPRNAWRSRSSAPAAASWPAA